MAEFEFSSYPPIEPNTFDLILIGTGLPQSIIAAAASSAGKTVLHLDPNPYYGSHFTSLSISDLTSFLKPQLSTTTTIDDDDDLNYTVLNLNLSSLYSDVEISSFDAETISKHSRSFNIDLGGPRVLFCADKAIDLILKSGVNQYVEFKSIDSSFVCDDNGKLSCVPDSRAAIFKDKSLSLTEKNQLMRFFKLVQQHLENSEEESSESSRISMEDLESPFVEFLKKLRLPPKIKSFMNASGALIYPIYGHGELSQAFCRRAAVKGCIHVLRMPVISLLMDKESGQYKGVRLASGQDLFSNQLVLDPTFTVPCLPEPLRGTLEGLNLRDVKGKVARGICVTTSSLKADVVNFLVMYPPRTLYPEQSMSIRALQIGGNLAVCPSGMFILYFSALCDDAKQGKDMLRAAMNALLKIPVSEISEKSSEVQNQDAEVKPTLLWSAMYIHELTTGNFDHISSTPMPDGNLDYNDLLDETVKLFKKMYPSEEFFPEVESSPDNIDDED
ncbi:hypothetical protein CsatB_018650 [Cannabis sativa]